MCTWPEQEWPSLMNRAAMYSLSILSNLGGSYILHIFLFFELGRGRLFYSFRREVFLVLLEVCTFMESFCSLKFIAGGTKHAN